MAREFDRPSGDVAVNGSAVVSGTPLTMACWFKTTDNVNGMALVSVATDGSDDNRFTMIASGFVAGDPIRAIAKTTSVAAIDSSAGYSTGVWQHAAAVFASPTSRSAYVNGGNKGTSTTSRAPSGMNQTALARSSTVTPMRYDGDLGEVAIWNVALTDAEIAALGRGVNPRLIRPGALAFYAPLWGTSNPERDYTRGQRHLTLTGTTLSDEHPPVQPMPPSELWVPTVALNPVDGPVLDLIWDTRAAVEGAGEDLVWDLHAAVDGSALNTAWDLRSIVDGPSLDALWDLGAAVDGGPLDLAWDLIAEIAGDGLDIAWDLRAEASANPLELIWDAVGEVNAPPLDVVWDAIAQVNGGPLDVVFDLRSPIEGAALELPWDLRSRVDGQDLDLSWDLRAAVALALTLRWDMRARADGPALDLVWDVLAPAGQIGPIPPRPFSEPRSGARAGDVGSVGS